MRHVTITFVVAFALFGCKHRETIVKKQASPEVVDSGGLIDVSEGRGFPDVQEEKLIRSAEKLNHPASFPYAYEIINSVLEKNPSNRKALLLKHLLEPPMYFEGLATRILPYLKDNSPIRHDALQRRLDELSSGGLKDFLLAEGKPFETDEDISQYLRDYLTVLRESRKFFRENRNLVMSVNIYFPKNLEYLDRCSIVKLSEGVYDTSECELPPKKRIDINRADMEVLSNATAGLEIVIQYFTAYKWTGLTEYDRRKSIGEFYNAIQEQEYLKVQNDLGALKDASLLEGIKSIGVEVITSLRWAKKMENHVCPYGRKDGVRRFFDKGTNSAERVNRPGALFENGYCMPEFERHLDIASPDQLVLDVFETSLKTGQPGELKFYLNKVNPRHRYRETVKELGPEYEVHEDNRYWYWRTRVTKLTEFHPAMLLDAPMVRLQEFLPEFNNCGERVDYLSPSMEKIYPSGDYKEILLRGADTKSRTCTPAEWYIERGDKRTLNWLAIKFFEETIEGHVDQLEKIARNDSGQYVMEGHFISGQVLKFDVRDDYMQELETGRWRDRYRPLWIDRDSLDFRGHYRYEDEDGGLNFDRHYPALIMISETDYLSQFGFRGWLNEKFKNFQYGSAKKPFVWKEIKSW